MYLIFDTETTGLPKNWNAPITDSDNWPRAIQIAWQLHDDMGNCIEHQDYLIRPDGFDIPFEIALVDVDKCFHHSFSVSSWNRWKSSYISILFHALVIASSISA